MYYRQKEALPPLKSCDSSKSIAQDIKANKIVKDTHTYEKVELNSLPYRAAYIVTESMGISWKKEAGKNKIKEKKH